MKGEKLRERERRIQKKERWERIKESNFNKWYGITKGEDYLIT